jgi:hypothetical protein
MFLTLIVLLFATLGSLSAWADVLLIEQVRQAGQMTLPVNGQTMTEVEANFGAALSKSVPVGDPPITSWTYEHWTVYFEYDRVLFTVLNKGEVIQKKSG